MSSDIQSIHLSPELLKIAVPSPTLPPATHTNAWIIGPPKDCVVVDPGAHKKKDQSIFASMVKDKYPKAILLTHHHLDHRAGAVMLQQELSIPIWAHKETADKLPFEVNRIVGDKEQLALGNGAWEIIHTPGHAPGHVVLFEPNTLDCVCGDMVAGIGTIVINPPDGNLGQYMDSLEKLIALDVQSLHPAHGPSISPAIPYLQHYIDHRNMRTNQILSHLSEIPIKITTITKLIYPEHVGTPIIAIAGRQIQCHLSWLHSTGQVVEKESGWIIK